MKTWLDIEQDTVQNKIISKNEVLTLPDIS